MDIVKMLAYWIVTILMCLLFAFSAQMYFNNTEMVQGYFQSLGYPSAIVVPLAIAKVLGIVAVISDDHKILRELAYGGFMIDVILATIAHIMQGGGYEMSGAGIVLVILSRLLYQFRYPNREELVYKP